MALELEAQILAYVGYDWRAPATTWQWKAVCRKWNGIYQSLKGTPFFQTESLRVLAAVGSSSRRNLDKIDALPDELLDFLAQEVLKKQRYPLAVSMCEGGAAVAAVSMCESDAVVAALARHMDIQDLNKFITLGAMTGQLAFELGRRGDLGLIKTVTNMTPHQIGESGKRATAKMQPTSALDKLEAGIENVLTGISETFVPVKMAGFDRNVLRSNLAMGAAEGGHAGVIQHLFEAGLEDFTTHFLALLTFDRAVKCGRADVAWFFLADRGFSRLWSSKAPDVEGLLFKPPIRLFSAC